MQHDQRVRTHPRDPLQQPGDPVRVIVRVLEIGDPRILVPPPADGDTDVHVRGAYGRVKTSFIPPLIWLDTAPTNRNTPLAVTSTVTSTDFNSSVSAAADASAKTAPTCRHNRVMFAANCAAPTELTC